MQDETLTRFLRPMLSNLEAQKVHDSARGRSCVRSVVFGAFEGPDRGQIHDGTEPHPQS